MLASGLIVFREVLEAALIIGIVMVAARGAARRSFVVGAGLGLGISGAVIVALSANSLSRAVAGMGQEVFNAGVLMAAVAMLGWHNVWMGRHARDLTARMSEVGRDVVKGARPLYVLMAVVALAVLREGSEVVLFLYGVAAAQGAGLDMLLGAVAGLGLGAAVGFALYFGLLRIPTRHLFTVTSWMILLLAAGLASQAARYLVQADMLPALGGSLWDSSGLLSERSLAGQALHTLIGYTARPMGIQVVFYFSTMAVIGGLMLRYSSPATTKMARAVLVFFLTTGAALLSRDAPALANHKVYSPIVVDGELELETRGHVDRDKNGARDGGQKQIYELGYAFTDRWLSSVFLEVEKQPGNRLRDSAVAWENIIQFFEQGEHFIDVGAYLEYEVATRKGSADKFEGKILLEKTVGRFVHTANVIFEKELGANAAEGTELEYAWRSKFRFRPELELALEAFGSFGEIRDFRSVAQQRHSLGPVLTGRFRLGGGAKFLYEAGYLFGLTGAGPNGTFKWLMEVELPF